MFKTLKVIVATWLLFILVSSFAGGDRLRAIGSICGGVFNTVVSALADKADSLKAEAGSYAERIREWRSRKVVDGGSNS